MEKLAAMQALAQQLDAARKHRVEEAAQQDAQALATEEKEREKAGGQQGRFVAGLHRKAHEMDLGEALSRGRSAKSLKQVG